MRKEKTQDILYPENIVYFLLERLLKHHSQLFNFVLSVT